MKAPSAAPTDLPNRLKLVLVLLGISVFINYVDRTNLSIAVSQLKEELHLSPAQLGLLFSAFFWTYACLQPVAGWIVDRWNVNWVIAFGFFLWSAATAATGLVNTFVLLFAIRLMLGIGEAVAYPSYSKIIALHFPEEHRGRANSVISAGLAIGPGIGLLAGGMLMGRFGWRPFFVVLGLISLAWLVPWIRFMPKDPPLGNHVKTAPPKLSEFLKMRSAWGTCLGLFCGNYINYFLITWLPFFLLRERNLSMNRMGEVGAGAYFSAAVSAIVCGWLSDRWIASGATPTKVRKTFTAGGSVIAGIGIGASVYVPGYFSIISIVVGMIGFGMASSNVWAITQTLAGPSAAGRWTGFQNFVGNLAGVIAPAVTGLVLQKTGHLAVAFLMVAIVCWIGALCWIFIVGPVEQVRWGKREEVLEAIAGRLN